MGRGHLLFVLGMLLWGCSGSTGHGNASIRDAEPGDAVEGPNALASDGPASGSSAAAGVPGSASTGNDVGEATTGPEPGSEAAAGAGPDGSTPGAASTADVISGVAQGSSVRRLQREDFDRVVSDLLHVEANPSDSFPEEVPTLHGYFEDDKLRVNDRLQTELTLAAESLAQAVRSDAEAYDSLTQCGGNFDVGCRDRFVDDLVSRAYRRPASEGELAAYSSLFERGKDVVQSGDDFADGVQVVVEAVLQSPKFIYRIEQGDGSDELGTPLSDHELASRLSFLFWGTLPDEELRQAALAGQLASPEQIAQQARRLAESPRANAKVVDFHERWMQVGALAGVSKDADVYAPFSPELVDAMQQELRQFVTEVTLNAEGGITQLLTAPFGYSNALLDAIYAPDSAAGSDADGLALLEYAQDSPRAGLLTQAAFLSGHASSSTTTSPILRGIFVLDRLLCYSVPPPPANAAATEPPARQEPPATTREMFTWKTSMAECVGCHELINPIGYAFEGFDAIGRHRSTENGVPVDTSGTMLAPSQFEFSDAKELVEHLASLEDTRSCYARHFLEYAYARPAADVDQQTLQLLTDGFGRDGFGARQTLVTLAGSDTFTHLRQ